MRIDLHVHTSTGSDGNLPVDPFTTAADWTYTATTGEVHSASTLTALDSTAYSAW